MSDFFDAVETSAIRRRNRAVRIWLYAIAFLVFAIVIVGGATRLTESGLSITEWLPLLGVIPPLNEADWMVAFEKYKAIPQYREINLGMSLAEFKAIYWWEWGHRFLGRFIGLVFAVPMVFFWWRGWLEKGLKAKVVGLLVLGGLQGALGWYMVKSGLVDRTDVSQYRLAAHLTVATAIFAATLWIAFGIGKGKREVFKVPFGVAGFVVVLLIIGQMALGGLVAGLDAGHGYNTWPLMDGALVPEGLLIIKPVWKNFFENALTVQFVHRLGAYVVLIAVLVHAGRQLATQCRAGSTALVVVLMVFAQVGAGIATLLLKVPLLLALVHQGLALVVLAAALWHLNDLAICGRGDAK